MANLSLMDLAFYLSESDDSPKHVSGMMIFKLPEGRPTFVNELYQRCLSDTEVSAPFNQIIDIPVFGLPRWRTAEQFSMANHLFLHSLDVADDGEGEIALQRFCAELHDARLDRDKPLWEFHFITGLSGGRFAILNKIHHAMADGMTLSRWLAQSLNESPEADFFKPLWNIERRKPDTEDLARGVLDTLGSTANSIWDAGVTQSKMWRGIYKLILQITAERAGLTKNAVAVPFVSQRTPLTGQVARGRQIAVAKVPMSRIDDLRKRTRSSLNHIALTCIDGALHNFLRDCDADLDEPITINMPVNLRREGDDKRGNRIGIVLVDLAKRTDDPYERLREIGFTLRNVRHQVDGVEPEAIMAYTMALNGVTMLIEMAGMSNRLPPLGNTLVSNVPGPREARYLDGAMLEEMYPISTLPAGLHLNITLYSYNGMLYFGLVASQQIPDIHKLSDYISDAFTQLEAAI